MKNVRATEGATGGATVASIDDVDRRLLQVLSRDARIPNSALAAEVGIAASTCHLRVRRLLECGVIRGFRADIAPEALGHAVQAIIAVRLQPSAREGIDSFAESVAQLPGVLNVFFLAGVDDFQIHLATGSTDDLREFVVENLSKAREVATTQTSLIFQHTVGGGGLV